MRINPHAARLILLGAAVWLASRAVSAAPVTAVDTDGDGVLDSRDSCLQTAPDTRVNTYGCAVPGDQDGDGVADPQDTCPYSPIGAWVNAQGCAQDSDVDGVADGVDRCDGTPTGTKVDLRGCAQGQIPRPVPAKVPSGTRVASGIPETAPVRINSVMEVRPADEAVTSGPPAAPRPLAAPSGVRVAKPVAAVTGVPGADAGDRGDARPALPAEDEIPLASMGVEMLAFDPGQARLTRRARGEIQRLVAEWQPLLDRDSLLQVAVSGHGDVKTDGLEAPRIAFQRGRVVLEALVEAGVPAHRVQMRSAGVAEPRFGGSELSRNSRAELRLQRGAVRSRAAVAGPAAPRP